MNAEHEQRRYAAPRLNAGQLLSHLGSFPKVPQRTGAAAPSEPITGYAGGSWHVEQPCGPSIGFSAATQPGGRFELFMPIEKAMPSVLRPAVIGLAGVIIA